MSDAAKPEAKGEGNKKLIIIVVIAVLVSVGAAVGATLMLVGGGNAVAEHEQGDAEEGDEEDGEESAEEGGEHGKEGAGPTYVALEPAFVVNFQDQKKRTKFLKAEISVVAASAQAQSALTLHMPAVRNSLVMLLSRQVFEDLATNEGKERLRTEALGVVKEVVTQQTGKKTAKAVKDLYFSSLVMQ